MHAWEETFDFDRKQLQDPMDIVKLIPNNSRVILGHAAGEPLLLVDALVTGAEKLKGIEIIQMVPMGPSRFCEPGLEEHIRLNTFFVGSPTRSAVAAHRADFTPAFFSDIPRLIQSKALPLDVALICVSPPDADGWMSLGVSVDYTLAAAQNARVVIAEVNELMPRTFGAQIHISEVDYVVASHRRLPELKTPQIGEVERQIGQHIAGYIHDGDCLQLGIGSIPDAVLSCLGQKNELGIHTEMFSDGVVDLVRAGVITNTKKTIDRDKLVATFLMGTNKLYDFVHENPQVWMQPVDYTNNVLITSQLDHLISINSALQVDLYGQVCADMIGPMQFSGVGGQVDFVRSAAASKGGRSIIALPSTAKNGSISRIVNRLDPGACVTTSRCDVDTIVTEYGVAELRGKTLRQRQAALIDIAHPKFREALRADEFGMRAVQ
jgi:4-hydroxybutyrate CoA-transferase